MALRVLGPEAFRPALTALANAFSQHTDETVELTFGPAAGMEAGSIASRLGANEDHDVIFLPAGMTDQHIAAGRLNPETRIDVMRSMVALCVRAGASVPDISTVDALRETLLTAEVIGLSQAGSGVFVRDVLLARLGLPESVASRCKTITGQPVGAAVATGEVALGLQQLSELLQEDGIIIAGALPEDAQGFTVIAASTPSGRSICAHQTEFLTFLRSDQAASILRNTGLKPISA